jgi:hypothetical protein
MYVLIDARRLMRIIISTEECYSFDRLQHQTITTSQLHGLTPVSDTNIKTEGI